MVLWDLLGAASDYTAGSVGAYSSRYHPMARDWVNLLRSINPNLQFAQTWTANEAEAVMADIQRVSDAPEYRVGDDCSVIYVAPAAVTLAELPGGGTIDGPCSRLLIAQTSLQRGASPPARICVRHCSSPRRRVSGPQRGLCTSVSSAIR